MIPEPAARLAKDGTRVLCARISCGEEMARVVELPPDYKVVLFPVGWFCRRDGMWTETTRATRSRQRGRGPRPRRGNLPRILRADHDDVEMEREPAARLVGSAVYKYLARVRCPAPSASSYSGSTPLC